MFNYNTDPYLFKNLKESNPKVKLTIVDGQVYQKGEGFIARFDNTEKAKTCLIEAGFKETEFIIQG